MNKFRVLMSYLLPEKLESRQGNEGVQLNVYLDKGKIKVYTENTNYSGGKLKSVFQKSMQKLQFRDTDQVLILGFGLGSIWELLRQNHQSQAKICGVDYDKIMFNYLQTYKPEISLDKNTSLHQIDCEVFVKNCRVNFDYIFVDLFIDTKVSTLILNKFFWKNISDLMKLDSIVILNTMGISKNELKLYTNNFEIIEESQIFRSNSIFFLKAKK